MYARSWKTAEDSSVPQTRSALQQFHWRKLRAVTGLCTWDTQHQIQRSNWQPFLCVKRNITMQSSHQIKRQLFSYWSDRITAYKIYGKEQAHIGHDGEEKNISVKNSSFSLWRKRAGTLDKSTKSDMSFIIIYFQSNISSDWKK